MKRCACAFFICGERANDPLRALQETIPRRNTRGTPNSRKTSYIWPPTHLAHSTLLVLVPMGADKKRPPFPKGLGASGTTPQEYHHLLTKNNNTLLQYLDTQGTPAKKRFTAYVKAIQGWFRTVQPAVQQSEKIFGRNMRNPGSDASCLQARLQNADFRFHES